MGMYGYVREWKGNFQPSLLGCIRNCIEMMEQFVVVSATPQGMLIECMSLDATQVAFCSLFDNSSQYILKNYNILLFNFWGINFWLISINTRYYTTPFLLHISQISPLAAYCSYWSIDMIMLSGKKYHGGIRWWVRFIACLSTYNTLPHEKVKIVQRDQGIDFLFELQHTHRKGLWGSWWKGQSFLSI